MTAVVGAILLAAGRAQRFGAGRSDSKVAADLNGIPLVRHVAVAAVNSRATPVVVVTGHAAARVETALADVPVRFVHNAAYASGMAVSLKAGLAALPDETSGALVLLADMPLVARETLDHLIERFAHEPEAIDAVVPTFEGRAGNPVLIGRKMFPDVLALDGDEGARKLFAAPGRSIVYCAVVDGGIEIDVDTPAALENLRAR